MQVCLRLLVSVWMTSAGSAFCAWVSSRAGVPITPDRASKRRLAGSRSTCTARCSCWTRFCTPCPSLTPRRWTEISLRQTQYRWTVRVMQRDQWCSEIYTAAFTSFVFACVAFVLVTFRPWSAQDPVLYIYMQKCFACRWCAVASSAEVHAGIRLSLQELFKWICSQTFASCCFFTS